MKCSKCSYKFAIIITGKNVTILFESRLLNYTYGLKNHTDFIIDQRDSSIGGEFFFLILMLQNNP